MCCFKYFVYVTPSQAVFPVKYQYMYEQLKYCPCICANIGISWSKKLPVHVGDDATVVMTYCKIILFLG